MRLPRLACLLRRTANRIDPRTPIRVSFDSAVIDGQMYLGMDYLERRYGNNPQGSR